MTPCLRDRWTEDLARRLLSATVLVFALIGWAGARADASSASASTPFEAGDDSDAHHCNCGKKCRGTSCCCGRRKVQAPKPSASWADTNPCVNSAPCGDSGLPGTATASPLGKAATLSSLGTLLPLAVGRLMARAPRCILPDRPASRIDDPPERLAFA